jgi:hypothetical protein
VAPAEVLHEGVAGGDLLGRPELSQPAPATHPPSFLSRPDSHRPGSTDAAVPPLMALPL